MVANKRNVNALSLASLQNRHSFRNLVLVTVNLQRNKFPLSCYDSSKGSFLTSSKRTAGCGSQERTSYSK